MEKYLKLFYFIWLHPHSTGVALGFGEGCVGGTKSPWQPLDDICIPSGCSGSMPENTFSALPSQM